MNQSQAISPSILPQISKSANIGGQSHNFGVLKAQSAKGLSLPKTNKRSRGQGFGDVVRITPFDAWHRKFVAELEFDYVSELYEDGHTSEWCLDIAFDELQAARKVFEAIAAKGAK